MKARDFCYWLQGFFEITEAAQAMDELSYEQVQMIQRHLAMVFKHEIDPAMGDEKHQQMLNETHQTASNNQSKFKSEGILYRC